MTKRRLIHRALTVGVLACAGAHVTMAQDTASVRLTGDSITAQFVDADLRAVVQALARYLRKPVLVAAMPSVHVSLETPLPVAREAILPLLRGLLQSQNLELLEDSAFFRVQARAAEPMRTPGRGADANSATRSSGAAVQLFVIRLRHARAADVAGTVNQLFGGGGAYSGSSGLSAGTLSEELRRSSVPTSQAGMTGPPPGAVAAASSGVSGGPAIPVATGGAAAAPASGQRSAVLAGAVAIVPDEITNALLIRASREDFEVLQQAVSELDIRPLQVLIEVLIVEARTDRSFSLGSDLLVPDQSLHGNAHGAASWMGGGLGDLVVQVMNVGRAHVNATLRAAESRGDVKIISRPVLLASNNTEAHLLVGSQRPFVQVSRSLPTQTPTRDQVVQYRDVGTRLTVRPTINYDGYLSLQIQQEVNAATTETQFDAPIISTREAATRVLVRDSQTIMLGGLRDLQRSTNQGGVPLLARIPLLGGLFGSASRSSNETELFLFLTPRILRTDADADSVTARRLPADARQ